MGNEWIHVVHDFNGEEVAEKNITPNPVIGLGAKFRKATNIRLCLKRG